jgi:hypothetical protein
MAPKKQVSPAIRILRGERDASARATHLEAATRKFLVTTNERKQMSTKTNFKRIALVAVAALGLGVLSSVPSQAIWQGIAGSQVALSTTAATGTLSGAASDSTTAGTVSIVALALTGSGDSYTVTAVSKSIPARASATPALRFMWVDTATSTGGTHAASALSLNAAGTAYTPTTAQLLADSGTSMVLAANAAGYLNSKFKFFQDSNTARIAGSYVYTVLVTPASTAAGGGTTQTIDVTVTIAAAAADSLTIVPGSSTAFLASTEALATADAAVSALSTASSTAAAVLRVITNNTVGAAAESITVTISGAGILSFGGINGASLVVSGDGDTPINVLPDGRSGVATIAVSTTSRAFANKSMSFYAAAPATLVASVPTPNLTVGSNSDTVRVIAKDAAGVSWAGALYIYASTAADALIAGSLTTPVLCTWDAADDRHECPVAGTAVGTAKMKAINASTVALATVTSNEVSVVVNTNTAASVKLSFDKATYAPGERAYIYVTPLDSAGKEIAKVTLANLLAAGGISTNSSLGFAGSTTTSDSLTATVSYSADANSSSTSGAKAGSFRYTVYMPANGGTVTLTATGGTSLPLAARVATTATATITDSGAAALAAVTALATTVASLKTLITTLTNLVLKIQKKVKA